MKRVILLSLALLSVATTLAQAETRFVPAMYATIQQAIDDSNDGDVVIVEAGTYRENINFSGKNIVVSSTHPEDPENVAVTIIDGQGKGSVVVFENGETSEAVLTGFTITGGYGTKDTTMPEVGYLYWGGGVCCMNASPTIKCNVITGNTGPSDMTGDDSQQWKLCYGGGIGCIQSNAIVTRNIIKDNSAYGGGGIMVYLENSKITNNLIYDNSASIGGGVYMIYAGQLINNTIVGNDSSSSLSGGNVCAASHIDIGQCRIANNIICNAKSGGGIYTENFGEGYGEDFIAFNNVWNNLPGNYYANDPDTYDIISGDAVDMTGTNGNISQDPLFGDNFHIAANSPCHDAGDPNYAPYPWQRDIDGEYAVMGERVDIGADEVTGNSRPVADAGDDQFFDAIVANITLDGTGSFDFNADDVISYQWRQISGTNVIIMNPDTPEPNFAPPVEDIYIFELTVFDGSFYSQPDSVMIVVGNRAPIAEAGDEQACEPRQEVTLNGSASYDLDEDDTLSYSWSQISGPSVELMDPNTQTPCFTPNLIGEYVFELVVNDGTATSLPDTVTVISRIGSEPDAYGYHCINSDSFWGPKYNWTDIQDTGTVITGLDYSFEEYVGPFSIGFDFNFYGSIYKSFYVQSNGVISFNAGIVPYMNEEIPAVDEANNIIAWMWTYMYPTETSKIYYQQFGSFTVIQFVDYEIGWGGFVNAEVKIYRSGKIIIQYRDFSEDADIFQYTVGIENANGTIGTQAAFNDYDYLHGELAIEFSLGPPDRPVADAGPDQHVAEPQLITLDGSGSYVYGPDSFLEYEWDQLEGSAVELTDPTGMHPTFIPEAEGEYRFELVVIGEEDFSEPDEVLILVGNQPPIIDVGPNQVSPVSGRVTLDGTGSYDPDRIDELSYKWTQLEGPEVTLRNADTATPYFFCPEEGTYVFELVVTDGLVDSEPRLIEVATVTVTNNQYNLDPGFYTEEEYFHYPNVSGSKVVYSVGEFDNYRWSIKCKDLLTGELDEEFPGGGINTQPKIDGDIVVWAAGPFSAGFRGPECIGIYAKNIATGEDFILRDYSSTESYSHPAVSGNKVVWLEHLDINKNVESEWTNTPYSICGADITARPVYFTIAEHVGRRDPYPYEDYGEDFDDVIDICGNIVVYEAEGDIYGADISNINDIKVFTICSDSARQYDPAISGNIVVWTDERNDRADIYGADISDTANIRELVIARGSGNQQQPDIDGCLIVYIDAGRSYYGQVKVCCLTRQYSVMYLELADYPYGTGPAINADTIVWQNSNYGEIEGISLEFAYSGFDGSVQNLTTGKYYDFIQHAIAAGQTGETIIAGEGIYNESINFKGKKLTVSSANPDDPAVVAATVINGNGRVVTFSGGEDANSILTGFTITGGSNGIYCTEAAPVITDCTITGNTSAGIMLYSNGSPAITNCSIVANDRAGIEMHPRKMARFTYYNYPQISNSIIAKNAMQGIFGGVPVITNCTIVENLRDGIYGSMPTVTNSIIYYNLDPQIAESTATVTYSDIQGSWPGLGNIDICPLFAFPSLLSSNSTYIGDYHLKSQAGRWDPDSQTWLQDNVTSPCIDKGDPASPVGDEPVPNGGIINMGAYGGTAQASMTFSD